jgi:hypothetical protein
MPPQALAHDAPVSLPQGVRMSRSCTAVLVALALIACDRPTGPAPTSPALLSGGAVAFVKANTIKTNSWEDVVDNVVIDPCGGEDIVFNGRIHSVGTVTTSPTSTSGSVHLNFNALEGVGVVTGLKYRLVAAAKQVAFEENESPFAFSQETHIEEQLVSQTSADNFKISIIEELTFDGTDFTVTTKKMVQECRG